MKVTEVLWGKWAGDFMEGKLRGSVCGKNRPLQPKNIAHGGNIVCIIGKYVQAWGGVPHSGIYDVIHDGDHGRDNKSHVSMMSPSRRVWAVVQASVFTLAVKALHINHDEDFMKK